MLKGTLRYTLNRLIVSSFISLFFFGPLFAQSNVIKLNADTLLVKHAIYSLTGQKWFFKSGDNAKWAYPGYQDEAWQKVVTNFGLNNMLPNWKGIGWFRLWVQADTTLTQKTLGLLINHDGASEIYIDGVYYTGYGKVSSSKAGMKALRAPFEVMPFRLNNTKPHLIAIRYANFYHVFPDFIGFETTLGDYEQMRSITQKNEHYFEYMLLSTAFQLALSLLHLFLFIFYPKQRLNLYYFIFSVLVTGTNWAILTYNLTGSPGVQYLARTILEVCTIFATASAWHLLYKAANVIIPKWKIIVVSIVLAAYLIKYLTILLLYQNDGFPVVFLVIIMDSLWVLLGAIRRKQPFIWLIGMGITVLMLFYFFAGADVFRLWDNYPARCFTMSLGILSFPLCFSLYLALDFARTNQNLALRLAQVEELSANALAQETEKRELITRQAEKLELTVAERTSEVQQQANKLMEMDKVKSRFFINLTHEFRTPLTLILGPVQQILLYATDNRTIVHANTIYRNASRLLQLINQLLDLSKLEAGKMELVNTAVDIVALIKRNFLSFESLATEKRIGLEFDSGWSSLLVMIDQDKLEKILFNVLSNAVKFTHSNGRINLSIMPNVADNDKYIKLTVADTGIGIPQSKMPYIFDRFYQVDASDTRVQEGTGIGLAITKELTELMGGRLYLQSVEGNGTEVTVLLPIVEAVVQPGKIPQENTKITQVTTAAAIAEEESDSSLPLILVIEDNHELRHFIGSVMAGKYQVIEAANGEQGLATALERIPDLVVTDLMMPLMNGYQVCAGLKGNEKTSHVPVVILTAKGDTDSRIAGLETRADAYLNKPFDQRELLATVENLIALRLQLQEKYNKGNIWLTGRLNVPSMDQVFLDKVKQAVEQHLNDEQYGVDQLGDDIGLSRTQLHRKLKAVTGQSPGELIRAVRLQQANELLKHKAGTVAEVAYMVGFGNPNSFSTSFSKYFGFAPSEAADQ